MSTPKTLEVYIDGEAFTLDVEKAIYNNALFPKPISTFEIGDVFQNSGHSPIVIVKPSYTRDDDDMRIPCYGFIGRGLATYFDYKTLRTRAEVVSYINEKKLRKIGNINSDVELAISKLMLTI